MRRYLWLSLISLALVSVGCSRFSARTDSQIATDVQGKINGDNSLPDKQITINANQGVVTLSGNVSSDAARNQAASDAGQVPGVKTVINNLEVNPGATASAQQPQPQPEQQASNQPAPAPEPSRPSPRRSTRSSRSHESNNQTSDNGLRTTVPPNSATTATSGDNMASNNDQTPPQPTPTPAPQKVTIPSGTQIAIRLGQELNSETAQVGDVFHGSISTPIMVGDQTVVPTSADVEGRVVDVKSAGRFKGQSDLVLELTSLLMNGKRYNLATNQWSKNGSSRGKATAAKVGGGAALGAILGGVFGGGKGAAIGAAAGAGAGTGVSAATKGQQIDLKPETVLNFQLQNPVSVVPGSTRQAMNQNQ